MTWREIYSILLLHPTPPHHGCHETWIHLYCSSMSASPAPCWRAGAVGAHWGYMPPVVWCESFHRICQALAPGSIDTAETSFKVKPSRLALNSIQCRGEQYAVYDRPCQPAIAPPPSAPQAIAWPIAPEARRSPRRRGQRNGAPTAPPGAAAARHARRHRLPPA